LSAGGFKRLGDTFHLQQTLWFREPPSERCGANRIPDLTIAVAVCQQPQDACSCVAIFSHPTLHFTLHVPWEKPYISLGNLVTEP
jgi:hypothetical protein